MKKAEMKKTNVEVHGDVVREAELIENKELRDKLANRLDVLDKTKDLFLANGLNMMTLLGISEYYEVPLEAVRKCFARNRNEIFEDGVAVVNANILLRVRDTGEDWDIVSQLSNTAKKDYSCDIERIEINDGLKRFISLKTDSDDEVKISFANTLVFTKRAILRIGMLLTGSEVAKEIRTQLLNTFEHATDEQRTVEIDEEKSLVLNLGFAVAKGDRREEREAWQHYTAYKDRHIAKLEQENANINAENDLLSSRILTSGNTELLNRIVRHLASHAFNGDFCFAWNTFYKQLYYQKHISLKRRQKEKEKLIDTIRDEEWTDVWSVADAMCRKNKISMNDFLLEDDLKTIYGASWKPKGSDVKEAAKKWDAEPDYYEARGIRTSFANV